MSFPGSYRGSIPQEIRSFRIPAYAGMTAHCDKKIRMSLLLGFVLAVHGVHKGQYLGNGLVEFRGNLLTHRYLGQ